MSYRAKPQEMVAPMDTSRLQHNRECCIHRVPQRIRKINEEAYTPQLISIGPLHLSRIGYRPLSVGIDMEREKEIYMNSFCTRVSEEVMDKISTFIKNNKDRIKICYSEESDQIYDDEFLEMIKKDAIFIIELLVRNYICGEEREYDLWLDIPTMRIALIMDLQLLENQLPYFVLEKICKLAIARPTLMDLSSSFFKDSTLFKSLPCQGVEVKHFTDLTRSVLLRRYKTVQKNGPIKNLPSAMKLHESGVEFKRFDDGECLLDIRFEKRILPWVRLPWSKVDVLKIPNLELYDDTECLFRNIMALEQCYYPEDPQVCSYVELIDSLIYTKRDVDLLIEKGILTNAIGSSADVVKIFKQLCTHIHVGNSSYYDICKRLKKHEKNRWNRSMATLRREYFTDWWRGTATIVAVVVLAFQLTQVIYASRRSS